MKRMGIEQNKVVENIPPFDNNSPPKYPNISPSYLKSLASHLGGVYVDCAIAFEQSRPGEADVG